MGRFRVDLADSATSDLRDIIRWYDSQDAPNAGRRLVTRVIERIEQLAAFPDSGKVVPEFDIVWLRELEMPPFRIVSRRDEDTITVVRVWRSERLMDTDLTENA